MAPPVPPAPIAIDPAVATEQVLKFSQHVFERGTSLLAFVLAFYALTARERRTPYITNSIYPTVALILLSVVFAAVTAALDVLGVVHSEMLEGAAAGLFVVAATVTLFRIAVLHNRHVNFRDDNLFKNLTVVRSFVSWCRSLQKRAPYEHNPGVLDEALTKELSALPLFAKSPVPANELFDRARKNNALSIGLIVKSFAQADEAITQLAGCFLRKSIPVQYTSCGRHPSEFVFALRESLKAASPAWNEVARYVVVVDAYTPHFGFTDSVHNERRKSLEREHVSFILSSATYAGVHTAAAKAFNRIKSLVEGSAPGKPRPITLVVYETPRAFVDLESPEQYNIFVRHVIPSERLWGGMITVFLESSPVPAESPLHAYADAIIDLSSEAPSAAGQGSTAS